jgi:hypothetical protein
VPLALSMQGSRWQLSISCLVNTGFAFGKKELGFWF